jgi:hypothetical protein
MCDRRTEIGSRKLLAVGAGQKKEVIDKC